MPASINRFWAVKLSMAITGTSSSWADASWRATKWANDSRWRVIGKASHRSVRSRLGSRNLFPAHLCWAEQTTTILSSDIFWEMSSAEGSPK